MIKLKDLLTENKTFVFQFNNSREYDDAVRALSKHGWYRNGNGNPPSDEQLSKGMIYTEYPRSENITVKNEKVKDVKKLFDKNNIDYIVSNKRYSKYHIINHGGHLD
jgi:hypothetical protein